MVTNMPNGVGHHHGQHLARRSWRPGVRHYVDSHAGQAAIVRTLDSADIINREREQYVSEYCTSVGQSSLQMYRVLNPYHQLAPTSPTIFAMQTGDCCLGSFVSVLDYR